MSGGSYDYLYTRARPLGDQRNDLERMAIRLEGLPWAAQAAAATRRCLTAIDDAERLAESLYDVWHAIEWWDSGDWGEERARQNVEGYQIPDGKVAEDVLYRLVDVGSGVVELRAVRAAG